MYIYMSRPDPGAGAEEGSEQARFIGAAIKDRWVYKVGVELIRVTPATHQRREDELIRFGRREGHLDVPIPIVTRDGKREPLVRAQEDRGVIELLSKLLESWLAPDSVQLTCLLFFPLSDT
jgi:hypothetical protein